MNITYCPGTQVFITAEHDGRRFAVLLDASAADLIESLWRLAEKPFDPIELIDVLASRGLGALPDFAYVIGDAEQVRIFLRGDLRVEVVSLVDGAARAESHYGGDVSTWSEFLVRPAASVRLISQVGHDDPVLPLRAGVVRAGEASLVWSQVPFDSAAPASAPVTAGAELRPEPEAPAEPPPPLPGDVIAELLGEDVTEVEALVEIGEKLAEARYAPMAQEWAVGDPDGHTISAAEIARLRAARAGAYDASDAETSLRPRASLRMPSGEAIEIDRPVYIGRSPSARQAGGAELPRLVKIGGDDVDISRTHVEVRFEGRDPVVTDLSTNGTLVIRDGAEPQRLQPRTAAVLTDGTVLQLSAATSIVVSVEAEIPDGG